jgi:hypothetical protein
VLHATPHQLLHISYFSCCCCSQSPTAAAAAAAASIGSQQLKLRLLWLLLRLLWLLLLLLPLGRVLLHHTPEQLLHKDPLVARVPAHLPCSPELPAQLVAPLCNINRQ